MQIVILGMHRSGTSVVTRLVNTMGAYFGHEGIALGSSQRQNPKGFWERLDILALDEELLASAGASWHRVSTFSPEAVPEASQASFERKARKTIAGLDTHRPWVVKEPRMCLLLPFWRPLLELPVCILVHRSPLAVARSLRRRNGFPLSFGIALWERHALDALRTSVDLPRVGVTYESILAEPVGRVERLWRELRDLGVGGLRLPDPREITAFVEPGLNHEIPDSGEEARFLSVHQMELAQALASGHALGWEEIPPLSAGSRELLQLHDETFEHRERIDTIHSETNRLEVEIESAKAGLATQRRKLLESRAELRTLITSMSGRSTDGLDTGWRDPLQATPADHTSSSFGTVSVIVAVRNPLEEARRCLTSILLRTGFRHQLVLMDLGADESTSRYLAETATRHPHVSHVKPGLGVGSTKALDTAIRDCDDEVVVLLHADTVVSRGWLARLLGCLASSEEIGIAGPISNAAGHQSVPALPDEGQGWSTNPLPPEWDVERMACMVATASHRRYPRVPVLNDFCLALRRRVLDTVGPFDDETFPDDTTAIQDFCLRATHAGFQLAVADDTYVLHVGTERYASTDRMTPDDQAETSLTDKHGPDVVVDAQEALAKHPELEEIRADIERTFDLVRPPITKGPGTLAILFVLPVRGGGGGVHSIVQEVCGMRRLGVDARVAVPLQHRSRFHDAYPNLDPHIFLGFTTDELPQLARDFHVAVATIFTSVRLLASVCKVAPDLQPAYYIQDYEPWIVEPGSDYEQEALESYTLIPDMLCFAKTRWLCETVSSRHDVQVRKVRPSIDRTVYHPPDEPRKDDGTIQVAAMVRPSTAYRGPGVTMQVLQAISRRFGDRVRPVIFGCDSDDPEFLALERDFEFSNRGVLLREQVADLLRESHVFVDFSTYQAFGRTALEAMACGCAVTVPRRGGTSEYAVHRENALVVDTSSTPAMEAALAELLDDEALRTKLAAAGLETARSYNIHRAAVSELTVFRQTLLERFGHSPASERRDAGATFA